MALICLPHLRIHVATVTSTPNTCMSNFKISVISGEEALDWALQRYQCHSQSIWSPQEYWIRYVPCHTFCRLEVPVFVEEWDNWDSWWATLNTVSLGQQPRIDHGAFAALATGANNSRNNITTRKSCLKTPKPTMHFFTLNRYTASFIFNLWW